MFITAAVVECRVYRVQLAYCNCSPVFVWTLFLINLLYMDLHEIVRKLIMDYAHALINKKKLVSMCVNITFEQEHLTTTQYTAKQIHFFFLSFRSCSSSFLRLQWCSAQNAVRGQGIVKFRNSLLNFVSLRIWYFFCISDCTVHSYKPRDWFCRFDLIF